ALYGGSMGPGYVQGGTRPPPECPGGPFGVVLHSGNLSHSWGLPRADLYGGGAFRETTGEKVLHGAGKHRHADRAPGLLVAGGVENVGVAFILEQVHIRVVDAFTRAGFQDRIKGA